MVEKPDSKINDFIKRINKEFKVELAVLFGSRARGDYLENSDYDVLIVSKDFENMFFTTRISELYKFWKYFPIDIEPLCYTPEEFEKMKKRIGIVQQALKEGIVLYYQ